MKPAPIPLSDPGHVSINRVVLIVGAAAIFLGGLVFGRLLPQGSSGPASTVAAPGGDAPGVQVARNRTDYDWLTAPFGSRDAPERPASSQARGADTETYQRAAPGAEAPPRAGLLDEGGLLGSVLQSNPVLGQSMSRALQDPKPRNQSRSRTPSYRPPRVEDPAEEMYLHDDASFEAWWNAPDKEEPISDEDRAFNEWWESEEY